MGAARTEKKPRRRQNFQNISWFLDLHNRGLLDMSPPYQRRSVWNDTYREQFIDTILLDYPAPAIFLFSRIDPRGSTTYELVDGKQRLETIFMFINGEFPVSDLSEVSALRGKVFESFSEDDKIAFFEYDFPVEYLPTNNEQVINNIFDRLNRNTVKLTPQELRHARFSGKFIEAAEDLTDWMEAKLTKKFPRMYDQSKRQMKDVEFVATLLLFLEEGPRSHSILSLDAAFAERDKEWDVQSEITDTFRAVIEYIARLTQHPDGQFLAQSRFRNQADFYSLFAAIAGIRATTALPDDVSITASRLKSFLEILDDETRREQSKDASDYYAAARSASNDQGPRSRRISVMKAVLTGAGVNGQHQ
jgi:hypothetical protein